MCMTLLIAELEDEGWAKMLEEMRKHWREEMFNRNEGQKDNGNANGVGELPRRMKIRRLHTKDIEHVTQSRYFPLMLYHNHVHIPKSFIYVQKTGFLLSSLEA